MNGSIRQKVNLIIGSDIVAHREMGPIVEHMVRRGIEPVLFYPAHKPSSNANARQDMFKDYAFFERLILQQVVYPFLEKNPNKHAPFRTPTQVTKQHRLRAPMAVDDINDPAFLAMLSEEPQAVGTFSLRCTQMFRLAATNTLKSGDRFLLNLHSGLLPEFRGLYSTPRAIAEHLMSADPDNSRAEFGCTLHHIDPYTPANGNTYAGIDTGNILDLRSRKIEKGRSVYATNIALSALGANAVNGAVDKYLQGESLRGYRQNDDAGRYYSYASPEELDSWKQAGLVMFEQEEVIRILIDTFSVPGTEHATNLECTIRSAIKDYYFAKAESQKPSIVPTGANVSGSGSDLPLRTPFGANANGGTGAAAPKRTTARRTSGPTTLSNLTARPA